MESWVIVIIVVCCLIVFYIITGFIVRFLLKRAQNKVYDEMAKVAPTEDTRLSVIKEVVKTLNEHKYFFPKQFSDLIEETDAIMTTRPIDVVQAKNNNDFLIMYFRKYITEKKLDRQQVFKECLDTLNANFFDKPSDKNSPYYRYNKAALRYNAYFGLLLYIPFTNRYRNQQASIF